MIERNVIEPGATLGVFGGGQLGKMFASAAARLGYRVRVYAPERDCPASQSAWQHTCASYDDLEQVQRFARCCDAITVEFENIPSETLAAAQEHAPVRPSPDVVAAAQDRLRERALLDTLSLPTAAHAPAPTLDDLRLGFEIVGAPAVLKTSRFGYDGKGQARLERADQLEHAWNAIGKCEAICEAWVDFDCELSVVVARAADGSVETFGPMLNHHRRHILDVSVFPAMVERTVAASATELARSVADGLRLEGLICVEMFLTRDGTLLINELAPRPHNSGHLSIELCATSQFEQQVRALCNLPLAPMRPRAPAAAMANLLGDLWGDRDPDWTPILRLPDVALHLYGKREAKPGRKMGHLTATAATPADAESMVRAARSAIEHAQPSQGAP